jgi:hypothetical protein
VKRLWIVGFLALVVGFAAQASADSRYQIRLLDQSWTPEAGVADQAAQRLNAAATTARQEGQQTVHALVQLYEIPDQQQRAALWKTGLDLGAYVPGNAFIAAIPAGEVSRALAAPELRTAIPWDASRKVHPRLRSEDVAPWARDPSRPDWVMLMVQLHHDVDLSRLSRIADKLDGVLVAEIDGIHGGTLWLPQAKLELLAQEEEVLWVEEGVPPLSETNDGLRSQMRAEPVFSAPYSLDGTGVRLFIFDGGRVRASHETFRVGAGASRVTTIDTTSVADHSTHVAGTAIGDGAPSSTGGRARGVAVGATGISAGYQQFFGTMLFWDNAGDIQADYNTARNTHNADLGTNSIGSNTASNGYPCAREGDYGVSSNLIDGIVRGDNATVGSAVMMTWANGNERTGGTSATTVGRCGANYLTTAPPSCAKNPIHVGALYSDGGAMTSFSSWGPCDDGRLKPIVSTSGCETGRVSGESFIYSSLSASDTQYGGAGWCGTSMATPGVAGLVSLFIDDWRDRGYGGATARPLSALVKAMLIQTARDMGQDGPDYIHGYGSVDAKALIDLLHAGNDTLTGSDPQRWGTNSITNGSTQSYTITVPAGTGQLKASLAWDDAAAASFAGIAPVNDLDLELVSPTAVVFRPWVLSAANPYQDATTGVNTLDNQEQVLVNNPAAGTWTVRVVGSTVPTAPQSYGLTFTALPTKHDQSACSSTAYGFETGVDGFTLTGGAARLASPAAGHGSWSLRLGGSVSSTHEAYRNITIPADVGLAEVTFYWWMSTLRTTPPWGADHFIAEIRDATSGVTLDVLDVRFDGWQQGQWMHQAHADVSQFAGQTVRLAFRAVNNAALATTFWVDDVALTTCPLAETDVWSRDLPLDTGIEPDPLPGPMWTSPDIWNRQTDDGGTVHENPEFGQVNYLHANVRNRSLVEGVNVPVKFYYAQASAGLAWPTDWTLIGTDVLPSVMPGQVIVAKVPFNPPGTGHFCILVRLDTAQDPMTFVEVASVNTNTRNNNNIVWRNMNVVNLVTGAPGGGELQEVTLLVRNVERQDRLLDLVFRQETVLGGARDLFVDRGLVTVVLDEELADRWNATGDEGEGIERIDDRTFRVVKDQARIPLDLTALDTHQITLAFQDVGLVPALPAGNTKRSDAQTAPDDETATYFFSVVQVDPKDPKGDPIGGVTYEIQTDLN